MSVHGAELCRGDGVCKYLDDDTNHCVIYENRPLFCNVDEAYDAYFRPHMSRAEYNVHNSNACKQLQSLQANKLYRRGVIICHYL